jgi:hypothetical protein
LYLAKDEFKQARELFETVIKSNAEEDVRHNAETLLGQLKSIENAKAETAENDKRRPLIPAPTGAEPVLTKTTEKDPPTDPSSYLREVLRPLATGETQLQGTLLRLECDAKGAITFVVQDGASLLRLHAASFDDMELTTYDTAVKGQITCGERKPANMVIVDYVVNTDKKLKFDGVLKSIEFVPADFKLKPTP